MNRKISLGAALGIALLAVTLTVTLFKTGNMILCSFYDIPLTHIVSENR